jgi:hypothetical protein
MWSFSSLLSMLLVVSSAGLPSIVQEPLDSLKDVARRLGGTATSKIIVESPLMSLEELTRAAELIVRGRLDAMTVRLSDDESTVFRDFTVSPLETLKQPSDLAGANQPRPAESIVLRQLGGTIVVDGLTLTTSTNWEHRDTPMVPGQDYVLFLSRATPSRSTTMSSRGFAYALTSVHWGAYLIQDGQVVFTRFVAQRTNRIKEDPAAFIAQIRGLVNTSK